MARPTSTRRRRRSYTPRVHRTARGQGSVLSVTGRGGPGRAAVGGKGQLIPCSPSLLPAAASPRRQELDLLAVEARLAGRGDPTASVRTMTCFAALLLCRAHALRSDCSLWRSTPTARSFRAHAALVRLAGVPAECLQADRLEYIFRTLGVPHARGRNRLGDVDCWPKDLGRRIRPPRTRTSARA